MFKSQSSAALIALLLLTSTTAAAKEAGNDDFDCGRTLFPLGIVTKDFTAVASATLLDKKRWLFATAYHVVEHAKHLHTGSPTFISLKVIAAKPEEDLVLLAPTEGQDMGFLSVALGLQDTREAAIAELPKPGEHLISCSYGLEPTLRQKEVEIVEQQFAHGAKQSDAQRYIHLKESVAIGESGGGLFTRSGQLAGVLVTVVDEENHPVTPGVVIPAVKFKTLLEEQHNRISHNRNSERRRYV